MYTAGGGRKDIYVFRAVWYIGISNYCGIELEMVLPYSWKFSRA